MGWGRSQTSGPSARLGLPLFDEGLVVFGEVGDEKLVGVAFDNHFELVAFFGDQFRDDGVSFFVGEGAFGWSFDFCSASSSGLFAFLGVVFACFFDSDVFVGKDDAIEVKVLGATVNGEGVGFSFFEAVEGGKFFVIGVEVVGPSPAVFLAAIHFGGFFEDFEGSFASGFEFAFHGNEAIVGKILAFAFEAFAGAQGELVDPGFLNRELVFERGDRGAVAGLVASEFEMAFAHEVGDVGFLFPFVQWGGGGFGFDGDDSSFFEKDRVGFDAEWSEGEGC